MNVIPYDYKPAKFKGYFSEGYWVTIYCLFDGKHVHFFAHQHDAIENIQLCRECGVDTDIFTKQILVTPLRFRDIFNEIKAYENVSCPDSH